MGNGKWHVEFKNTINTRRTSIHRRDEEEGDLFNSSY